MNLATNVKGMKSTIWYRLIIIAINVILIPIGTRDIQLQTILIIIYDICYIFLSPVLFGILVCRKYYPMWMMLVCCAFSFTAMHVFAIIRVQEYYPVYEGSLVFTYVWLDQGTMGIDWLVNLAPVLAGLLSAIILTAINWFWQNRKNPKFRRVNRQYFEDAYRDLCEWYDDKDDQ